MAAVTLLGTGTLDTNSGTKTVTATPAVNDLIVIVTAHTNNTATTAPTDNNSDGLGTYTLAETAVMSASADTMKIWIRDARIGNASSTVFTHAPGTTTGGGIIVHKVTGMSRAGASAKVKSGHSDNNTTGAPSSSWTGGGSASSANPLIGAVFQGKANQTPPSGWTERFDSSYASPTTGVETASIDSGSTASTVTWGVDQGVNQCSLILELDVSAGGTSFNQTLTATVTGTATITKSVGKPLTATSTITASIIKSVGKTLSATATATASIIKSVGKKLTATATATASMIASKAIGVVLIATVSSSASMVRQVGKKITTTVTLTAGITKQISHTMSATATATASITKQIGKTLSATITGVASIVRTKILAQPGIRVVITFIPRPVAAITKSILTPVITVAQALGVVITRKSSSSVQITRDDPHNKDIYGS